MALINLSIFSESLGMQTDVQVIIPQKSTVGEIGTSNKTGNTAFKCLYLLHGLTDNQSVWMRRTSIERYASEYGICIVMPMGARSFYTDMKYGMRYYTYVAKELPEIIESMFNVSSKREDRFIGGNSMGGYGAIKIALTEKERYAAAFALSPVTDIRNENFTDTLIPVFGEEIPDSADLFYLSKQHNCDNIKPRIYATIAKNDFMYNDAIRFNENMQSLNYDYKYVETEGAHSWNVWDQTVRDALAWLFP